MRNLRSVILTVIIAILALVIPAQKAEAATVTASGSCGENVTWSLDSDGTLTISGSGKMDDFGSNYDDTTGEWYADIPYRLYKDEIKKIVIGENIEYIGSNAFNGCSKLTEIIISNNVTGIGYAAFYDCSSLTSIVIPDKVTKIGDSAFYGCSGLTSVTIPDSVVSIGSLAFCGCSGIITLTIGNGVKSLSSDVFRECTGITSLTIPDNITNIGSCAFYGCSSITGVTIPDSVVSIGSSAFDGCSGITTLTIGKGVTSLDYSVFRDCTGIISLIIPGNITNIGSCAFDGCSGITSLIISDGVTSIENSAFGRCSGLTSIDLPNSLTNIGYEAFCLCTGLTNITIPNSVTNIGDYAFNCCSNLIIEFPIMTSSVTIGEYALSSCKAIVSPNACNFAKYTVRSNNWNGTITCAPVGEFGADGHTFSAEGEILIKATDSTPGTVKYSCKDCGSYITFQYYADDSNARFSAIDSSDGYFDFTIPNTVDGKFLIGNVGNIFQNVDTITGLTLNSNCTEMASNAFYGCNSLTKLILQEGITNIGNYALANCYRLTNIIIPDSVTTIEGYAFNNCIELASITIPDSVTNISYYAFSGCTNLSNVNIPSSVSLINIQAFYNCKSLKSLTILNSKATIYDKAIGYTYSNLYGTDKVMSDFVLYGKSGSTAEKYAKNNGITFTAISDDANQITYVLDGGTNSSSNPSCYTTGTAVTLADPSKEGYKFLGWYTDANFNNKVTSIASSATGNVILYAKWEFVYSLSGYQMTIDSDFNLKYYLKVSDGVLNSSSSYMKFVVGSEEITSAIKNSSDNNSAMYMCEIPAKKTGDTISAYLVYDGDEYYLSDYSVKEYLDTIISNPDCKTEYDLAKDLAKSILTYAAYTQIYFGYNTDNLANKNLYSDPVESLADNDVVSAISTEVKGTLSNSDFTYYGASLICDSSMHLKLYLNNTNKITTDEINSKYDFEVIGDGVEDVTVGADGSFAYVELEGIPSYALNTYYDISADGIDIKYSPYIYIKEAMFSENVDLKNLCKALYLYNIEATEYYTGKAL